MTFAEAAARNTRSPALPCAGRVLWAPPPLPPLPKVVTVVVPIVSP